MKKYRQPGKGKRLIFRWYYRHPESGKIIRAHHRPFPMVVDG